MASRVLTALLLAVAVVVAMPGCGPGSRHQSPEAVATAYLTAWQRDDVGEMLACFPPDAREVREPYRKLIEEAMRIADDEGRGRPLVRSFEVRTVVPVEGGVEGVDVLVTILLHAQ